MTKQLNDLFVDFLEFSPEEQLEKVAKIRHTRTIERPKAAVKRRKKEAVASDKKSIILKKLAASMSPEEIKALKESLKDA